MKPSERPVSPATTAREWLDSIRPGDPLWQPYIFANCQNLHVLLEAYSSSQSEKLVGIGQEAADRFKRIAGWTTEVERAGLAAIIENLVAERLAK